MLDLSSVGLANVGKVYYNLSTPALYEEAVKRGEAQVSHLGPLVVDTGKYTGRSPNDKFVVQEPSSEDKIWWGKMDRPFEPQGFEQLKYGLG